MLFKGIHRRLCGDDQRQDPVVPLPTFVDFPQAVAQRLDQGMASLTVGEQVVFQIRIPLHHPDVAEHLIKHPGGAAGDPLGTQLVKQRPHPWPEQADDDLAVGKRGVVVRNLAQTCVHHCSPRLPKVEF